jgi:hypothetical protein
VGAITMANSDTVPAGSVISQTPSGGTSVAPGTAVNLTISLGVTDVTVPIDIKPGNKLNKINLKSKGQLTVTILGSIDFDAMQVDHSTVTFGPAGALPRHDGHVRDVNRDGFQNMKFPIKIRKTGITCGDTEATLTGATFGDIQFTGTDTVKTVGCK